MLPAVQTPTLAADIAALAARYRRANGPVMRLLNRLGGRLEAQFDALPEGWRRQVEQATARALETSYLMAGKAPDLGDRLPFAAAMVSGAAGGAGGLVTSVAEIPLTVTLFFNTIRAVAREAGFDPDTDAVRAECLAVFAAGSPVEGDDGVNTSFLTARLTLTGAALQSLITTIAPRLALVLGQKLAAQAVPVIGAVSGAGLNAAYLGYYRELARVRFGLLRLAETHGADIVQSEFRLAVTPPRIIHA
ncbi:EcsC protein [Paracoccaceae bacterium]